MCEAVEGPMMRTCAWWWARHAQHIAHQMLAETVNMVHGESEQKTGGWLLEEWCWGKRVSSGEMGTDGDSVGSQETRLPASNLASLKSVQQC